MGLGVLTHGKVQTVQIGKVLSGCTRTQFWTLEKYKTRDLYGFGRFIMTHLKSHMLNLFLEILGAKENGEAHGAMAPSSGLPSGCSS